MTTEVILIVAGVVILFLVLLAIRLHVALSLTVAGLVGTALLRSLDAAVGTASNAPFSVAADYALTIIPLFILMGILAVNAGLADAAFNLASKLLTRLPGGTALASIAGSGLFAAVTGSSVATVATMARISTNAIVSAGHSIKLAAGVVSAGGTLGVLIPPSIVLVLYGVVTNESIGDLLIAGIIPGLITIAAYSIIAILVAHFEKNPDTTVLDATNDKAENALTSPKLDLLGVGYLAVIFLASIGTIYLGVATPTEAASFGAIVAFIIFFLRTKPPQWLAQLKETATEAVGLTAMTFLLMAGAGVFTYFLALSGASSTLVSNVVEADFPPYLVLVLCLLLLIPLGMFLDGISMVLIAAPLLHPILTGYGFEGVWLGILIVKVAEMALITPPVGMNAFVYSGAVPEAGLVTVFKGIVPFILADIAVVAILIVFPELVSFLPNLTG
ncbi:TRAP transporter large permease [Corynebacterium singulare]|uniref:TRAP-type C4-dicarboxylate transport system, large permease component n=1 Tax=Corynebacterium singulare TaxID=161899 RepID=A0A0B6EPZ1_9CORY|nr:TRAP transporter large permease [Corynebacterium singulare]AJI78552.1 TRAP-type C4-dicarboxylate transport system, large permease component [Corynebacterium singulare]